MSYKSGHIYLVDKEPTNEELANFSKPVQFDICKDGLFYSILYDKNGNRYVEDRSKITTGFIKLGTIVRVGNVINIGVHPSGFNHWRINGVDVTSSNPVVLELEPETVLYRIDSIVGNSAGGIFIFQGDADRNPIPLNPLNYPNYAFFKDVLITPNTGGSIDPEILNNYVSKEEESWKTITVSASTSFSINITDKRTRFKVRSTNDIPKVLQSIVFSEETSRALEIWIYNDTNLNFSIPNSATNGLSKGFTTAQPPFIILPKTYAKLKYNPQTDLIECWKVNSTSGGGISTVTTDSTLQGDGSESDPLRLSDAKNAEIADKLDKSMFSALVDKMLHYYNLATQKMQSTGVEFISAGILKLKSIILTTNTGTALPNELGFDGVNVVFGVSKRKLRYNDSSVYTYTPTGNFNLSAVKTAMENDGYVFNDSHIIINLGSNNFTCSIDNGASNPNTIITIGKRGSGSISFNSTRTLNSGIEAITIMNGNEGSMAMLQFGSVDFLTIKNL